MNMTYFTSDWHMNHYKNAEKGVIQYCGRPFPARLKTPEMNARIIEGFQVLDPSDHLYFLGDAFLYASLEEAQEFMSNIPCPVTMIRGNHDRWGKAKLMKAGFAEVLKYKTFEDDHFNLKGLMIHDPVAACIKDLKDHVIFCGHIHQLWRTFGRCINVGVDVWDYTPVALDQLHPLVMQAADQDWAAYHDVVNPEEYRSRKV
jgi:calcineurin-like phosphoesterase family protein